MKIAILGIKGIPGRHGVEVVVDSLVPYLVSMGHDITVYGYSSYTKSTADYKGACIKTVSGSSRKNCEMISHMYKALLDARSEYFDLVHIHSVDPCLLAWMSKTRYGLIATSHGQAYLRKKWGMFARAMSKIAELLFLHVPDVITSVSKPLADYYKGKCKKNVLYIPNGIDIKAKPHYSLLDKWSITPQNYLFCSAGRIERTKGLHTLLEAYQKLRLKIPLVIAGGGDGTDPDYFNKLKKYNTANVKFVGFLTGDEYYSLYAYARIFIFPSEYEAMSMTLLEGLSFGIPTIYSSIPENEVVATGSGYAFEVSNPVSLADKLHSVLMNPGEAEKVGKKAKNNIKKRHNWETIANQYNEIYMQLRKNYRQFGLNRL